MNIETMKKANRLNGLIDDSESRIRIIKKTICLVDEKIKRNSEKTEPLFVEFILEAGYISVESVAAKLAFWLFLHTEEETRDRLQKEFDQLKPEEKA